MYANGQKFLFNSIETPLSQVRMFHNLRSVPPEGQNLHHGQPLTQDSPSSSLQGPVRSEHLIPSENFHLETFQSPKQAVGACLPKVKAQS